MTEFKRQLFGEPWNAPICDPAFIVRVPTPVGRACFDCGDPILEGERGWMTAVVDAPATARIEPVHAECEMRQVLGSVGHLTRSCSCYGGKGNGDPAGISRHEAARLAWDFWMMGREQ